MRLPNDQQGQGLVEYAMILISVALIVMVIVVLLGPVIGNMYSSVNGDLSAF